MKIEKEFYAKVYEIKIGWIDSPLFFNSMGITITLSNYDKCPNECNNLSLICNVYNINGEIIEIISSYMSPSKIIDIILKYYFPQIEFKGSKIPNLDSKHVNIIVFKGDFMIPQNFSFISDLFEKLQSLKIGMKIAAETIGSSNKTDLPFLLSQNIIDNIVINLGVYPKWDDNVSEYTKNAFNSLTQCIDLKVENESLKEIGIAFLFDENSIIDVFETYIHILYDAYKEYEKNEYNDDYDGVFSYFNVYLRGDGTEKKGILEESYNIGIQVFVEDKIKFIPISPIPKKKCIFCRA